MYKIFKLGCQLNTDFVPAVRHGFYGLTQNLKVLEELRKKQIAFS